VLSFPGPFIYPKPVLLLESIIVSSTKDSSAHSLTARQSTGCVWTRHRGQWGSCGPDPRLIGRLRHLLGSLRARKRHVNQPIAIASNPRNRTSPWPRKVRSCSKPLGSPIPRLLRPRRVPWLPCQMPRHGFCHRGLR
jgi:hypothetical protein